MGLNPTSYTKFLIQINQHYYNKIKMYLLALANMILHKRNKQTKRVTLVRQDAGKGLRRVQVDWKCSSSSTPCRLQSWKCSSVCTNMQDTNSGSWRERITETFMNNVYAQPIMNLWISPSNPTPINKIKNNQRNSVSTVSILKPMLLFCTNTWCQGNPTRTL